ncbi:hypothetical protein K461DRAFT_290009 [Myriangium duriaei CBS 260.36]|uniref:Uncharacterized protein n=1 Tax=Myriangium duriaei CBS 260.36 TaxID=1168546 RepID=A0A9P4JA01_9PEZI|nr:hypothetical protein K461DRAFT_290009 [Myriangium duriaei CBS 260.36]
MSGFLSRSYHQAISTPHFVRFLTSWCLPPLALACIRAIFSLYIFTTLFTSLGLLLSWHDSHGARTSFSYFTILTYWGLGFYFAVSAFHGFAYATRGPSGLAAGSLADDTGASDSGGKRTLRFAHSAFYATITVFPIIVTAVFWGVLVGPGVLYDQYAYWANISEHAMNSAFAIFEIVIPRTDPNPWVHAGVLVVLLALYLALSFVSHAINHVYVYPFLNIQEKGSTFVAIAIVLILVAMLIVFAVVHGIMYFRKWVTESKKRLPGKFSKHDQRSVDEEKQPSVQVRELS